MFNYLQRKECIRLYLRRHVIRANLDREQLRNLQDCLEDPKPRRLCKKTWCLLSISFAYTLYVLTMKIFVESNSEMRINTTLGVSNDSVTAPSPNKHLRGTQLPAPIMSHPNESLDWDTMILMGYREAELHANFLKVKHLKTERQNKFTPKPSLEITEIQTTTTTENNNREGLPFCKADQNLTGDVTLNLSEVNGSLETLYPTVRPGGFYSPPDCLSRHKVAILVPYRKRKENLDTFLVNIHPFLMAQKLEYQIFVIEQSGTTKFNKGKLLNAGFKVLEKFGSWPCMVLHDVDLLPLSHRILYNCPSYPRLMSTALVSSNGTSVDVIDESQKFGGVTVMTREHYQKVNGHSNLYRGWGQEDRDMFLRLRAAGLRHTRNSKKISRYLHLFHTPHNDSDVNWSILLTAAERYKSEGLSTLEFQVLRVTYHHLFTHILVDLGSDLDNKMSYPKPSKLPVTPRAKTPTALKWHRRAHRD